MLLEQNSSNEGKLQESSMVNNSMDKFNLGEGGAVEIETEFVDE